MLIVFYQLCEVAYDDSFLKNDLVDFMSLNL